MAVCSESQVKGLTLGLTFRKPLKKFDFSFTLLPCGRVCLARKTRRSEKREPTVQEYESLDQDETTSSTTDTGLVSVANSHNPPQGRESLGKGLPSQVKPLTSLAKSRIVGACSFLERRYGKRKLTFWTGTVPTTCPKVLARLDENSSQVIKYFRLYISRALKKRGYNPDHIVIVLEYQKRGAIHLHAVFPRLPISVTDKIWGQVVTVIGKPETPLDFRCACRSEPIRTSAARYMAKYLSKGSQKKNRGAVWSIGRPLTAFLKKASLRLDFFADLVTAESLQNLLRACSFFTLGATWLNLSGYSISLRSLFQWLSGLGVSLDNVSQEFLYLWADFLPL